MQMVSTTPTTYPLPTGAYRGRFTEEVIHAVADLLQDHGFPLIADGADFERLRTHLEKFLYEQVDSSR